MMMLYTEMYRQYNNQVTRFGQTNLQYISNSSLLKT